MIVHISGTLEDIFEDSIVIDCNGLGYKVLLPNSYKKKLPPIGAPTKLITYHHIREDQQLLFGFHTQEEKQLFLKLTSVSGVGPKVGIKIMSDLPLMELSQAILSNNLTTLTSISGVGKKMAERLIIELKDKLDLPSNLPIPDLNTSPSLSSAYKNDLILALKTLGYSKDEIKKGILNAGDTLTDSAPLEVALKSVLKRL